MTPDMASLNKTFRHVAPPSVDLKTPRFSPEVPSPSAPTKTLSGFFGSIRTVEMAWDSRRPTFFQVLPASSDFQRPSPPPFSPVPTKITRGFDHADATAPM